MAEPEHTTFKTASASSSASRHRECTLCLETFVSPRLLPCFHTFCLKCLQRLLVDQNPPRAFTCPLCRAHTNVPEGGLEGFQVNFYVQAEMEAAESQGQPSVCEMCGQAEASHECVECEQLACQICAKAHSFIKVTKTHTVTPLNEAGKTAGGRSIMKRERFCSIHLEEKVRFFCQPCRSVICRDCKLTSHEGHPSVNLVDKGAQAKELAEQVTTMSRDRLQPMLDRLLKGAERQAERLANTKAQTLASMRKKAEELKKGVDDCLEVAEQELDEQFQQVMETIQRSKEDMTLQYASFLSLLQHVQHVTENGNDADLLELPAALTEFFGASQIKSEKNLGLGFQIHPSRQSQETKINTKLAAFLDQGWRLNLLLESPMPEKMCPHCSRNVPLAATKTVGTAFNPPCTSAYPTFSSNSGFSFGSASASGGLFGGSAQRSSGLFGGSAQKSTGLFGESVQRSTGLFGWSFPGSTSLQGGPARTQNSQKMWVQCDRCKVIMECSSEDVEMLVCTQCGGQRTESLRSVMKVVATAHIGRLKVQQESAKTKQSSKDQTGVGGAVDSFHFGGAFGGGLGGVGFGAGSGLCLGGGLGAGGGRSSVPIQHLKTFTPMESDVEEEAVSVELGSIQSVLSSW